METTLFLSKIVGPVLLLRAISIVINRKHFIDMLAELENEAKTVSFSLFPIAMLMTGIAVALVHRDTASLAAIIFHIIAWGMILKTSLLILFPGLMAKKARMIGEGGFLQFVCAMCFAVGAYLTWFGYFASIGG